MAPTRASTADNSPTGASQIDATQLLAGRRTEAAIPSLVVCSVGTDHHPFNRLVGWLDEWSAQNPLTEVVIQYGTADKPKFAFGEELIPHENLLQLFSRAALVVCHGGPSTVMDVRMAGKLPVVVPRDPTHGEHVDGHQISFGRHIAAHELGETVADKEALFAHVDLAIVKPERYLVKTENSGATAGVVAFGQHLDELLGVNTELAAPVEHSWATTRS